MSEEIKQNSQAVQEEEDLFGDFEVSQVQQQQQQELVIGENNSESHGNIEIIPVPQQQEQEKKEQLATGVQGEEEDLFGDFEETAKNQGDDEKGKIELDNADQGKDIVKNEEEEQVDEKQQQNDILNKDLEIQQKEQQAEIQQQVHQGEEDLFGDFDTSTPAQIVEPVKQTVDIIEKKEQEQEDLFGDFNEIEQENILKNVEESTHQVEQLNNRQEQENQEEKVGQIDGMKQEENINGQLNIENVKNELDSAQLETNQPDVEDLFGDFAQESKEKEVENGNKELNSHHDLQVQDSVNDIASDKIQHVEGIRENQEKIIKNEIEEEDLFGDFNENQEIVENKKDENDINVNEKCEELKEVAQAVLENNNDEKNENNEEPFSLNGVQQEVGKSQNENVERNEGDCGDVLSAENTKQLEEKEANDQVGIQSQDDEDLFGDFKGDSKQQDNQNHNSDGKIEKIETQNTKQEEDQNVDSKKCHIDLIDQEKKDEQKEEDCPEKNGQQEVQQEQIEVKTKDLNEDLFGDDFMGAKNTVESNQAQQPVEEGEHYSKDKQEEARDLLNEEENGGKSPEVVANLVELHDNVNLVQAQDKPVEEDLFGDFANTQQKQQGEDNSQPEQKEDTQVVTNKEEKQEQDGNNIEQIKHETNDQQDQKNDVEKHEEEIEMDGYQDQGKNDFVDSETNNEVIAEIDSQNQGGTHNASQHLEDQKQQEEEETQSNEVKEKQQGDQNGEESCKKSDQKDDKPEQQEDLFGVFENIQNDIQKKEISENDQIDDAVADEVAVKDVNQQKEEKVEEKSDQNRIVSSQQHDEPIDLFAEPNQIKKDDEKQHQQQDAVNVEDETNLGDLVSGVENNRSVPEQEDQSEFKEKQEDKNDNVEDSKDNQQKQNEEVIIEDTITQQQDHQEKNEEIQVISEEQELNNRIQDEEQKEKKIEVDTEEVKQTNQIVQSSIIAGDELIESEQNIKQEFSNNVKAEIEVNVPEQEKDEQQAEEIIQNTKEEDLFGDFNGDVNQQQGSQEDQSSINKAQTEEKIQEIKEIGAQEIPKTGEKGGNEQDDEDLFEDFAVSDNHGVDSKNIQTVHEKIEIEHFQEETVNQIIKTNNANETNDEDLFESEDKHEEFVMNKQTEGQVDQVNKDNVKDEGQEGKNNDIIQQEEDKSREEEKENIEENNDDENGRKEVRDNSDKEVIEEQGEVIAKEEVNNFDQIDLEKNEEIQTPKEYQNKQEKDIPLDEKADEKVNGEVNEDSEYFGVVDHEEKDKQKVQSAENLFEEFEDVVIPVQQGEEKITTEKQGAKQEEIEQGQNAHQADRVSDGDDFGDFEDVQNQEQIDQVKGAEYQRKEESIEEEKIKEDDLQHVHDENLNGSDDFGEFEETPKVHNIEEIKEISKNNEEKDYEQHKTKDEEDDEEFGDFEETPNVQTAEVAKENQKEEEKKVQVVEDQEEDEDGFGDFEDADVDTAPKQVTAQEQQSIQKVEGTTSEVAKVTEKKDTEEDEFGDFEETQTKAAPVAPPIVVQKPAVSSLNYKFPSQEVDFSLSGREVDYTKYLCSKLGESISGMFGIGNSNLYYRENERSHFDGDSELWMSKKYDELALRSAGNENLKIIAELFKEKQKTIAKTFIKHEKKIIGEPMKGSQLSVLKNNSVIWRDSSSKNNLLKSLRVKEDNDKTPKVEEQEDMLPSLKNISSKVSSTAPRQSSTMEDQSEIFSNQPKNQPIEPELKSEKSVNQSGSQESKQEIQKNNVEKINNKEQIQAQQQQADQKKKQVEEENIQKKFAEQEELNRQLKEKQQQDLEKKKQEQSRQLEQVLKQQEIDENNKKQAQEEIKKQENKALEKQDSEEDFDDFQDAEIAPSQQEEKQQPQQQQQTQIQAQNLNEQPIKNTNNLIDDDFDIFDAPPSKQSVIQTQPQKPAAQFFDLFDDTPSETLQKADDLSNNNQTNKNENQNFINNTSEHLSLYDIQPKKQEIVDQQLPSSDNQLDPAAVQFLQSLPDLGYVLSKSLCYPQTLFS